MFDIYEYILALTYTDIVEESFGWAPFGRMAWRYKRARWAGSPPVTFMSKVYEEGESSPLLGAGFFEGSVQRLEQALTKYLEFFGSVQRDMR